MAVGAGVDRVGRIDQPPQSVQASQSVEASQSAWEPANRTICPGPKISALLSTPCSPLPRLPGLVCHRGSGPRPDIFRLPPVAGWPGPGPGSYPVQLEVSAPARVGRWRPLIMWFLTIPLVFVLYLYGIVAGVFLVIGWFAALLTGRLPASLADFLAGYLRFQWRVSAYLLGFTVVYPSFGLPTGRAEPGGDGAILSIGPATSLSRLTVLFRYFMVIPQLIVLYFVGIAAYVMLVVGWFAVLFTGRWPEGMRNFVVGYFRWSTRVSAYFYMLTDVYPPFALDA